MSEGTVKLMRSPIDTHCADCGESLPFGTWIYYNPENITALCIECAVKRGWTPKRRVMQLITALELNEDIKALRKERRIITEEIMLLEKTVNILKLGERDLELESQIVKLMQKVEDYLHHCGTDKEAAALTELFKAIRETQELQKEVRDEVQNRLFIVDKKKKKLEKVKQTA